MLRADEGMLIGDATALVNALREFASILFRMHPFTTTSLASNWQDVLRRWISGEAVGEISRLCGQEAIPCIEDALSYRLVWGLEAVRVMAVAQGLPAGDTKGYAALALESGVNLFSAALLIQAGFSSRLGSLKAVRDGAGEFADFAGMAEWLRSELVDELSRNQDWPTLETSELWKSFREARPEDGSRVWTAHSFTAHTAQTLDPDLRPERLQVIHDEDTVDTWLYTDELRRVGKLLQPFSHTPAGLLTVEGIEHLELLQLNYFGPDFRTLRS